MGSAYNISKTRLKPDLKALICSELDGLGKAIHNPMKHQLSTTALCKEKWMGWCGLLFRGHRAPLLEQVFPGTGEPAGL